MSLNVLVVDDSAVMRSMIIKVLRMCGVPLSEVYEASNGEEGLRAINEHWIDLALVDINMPIMTGDEMIDHVRRGPDTKDLPVIVVSTESSESRIEMLRRQGAGFVHKPFSPEILRETITGLTGVSDEQSGDGAVPSGGYDF
jgi:two-component system chemotaxis response regulator CheY